MRESRRGDLQPLERAEDGDRRRDDPVTEEQRRAEDAERHQRRSVGDLVSLKQCRQRHDAAVATVVRAHDEARVLDRNDDHQRPEDQRNDTVNAGRGGVRGGPMGREDDLLGVKRARADIAVNDAEGAEREHRPAGIASTSRSESAKASKRLRTAADFSSAALGVGGAKYPSLCDASLRLRLLAGRVTVRTSLTLAPTSARSRTGHKH